MMYANSETGEKTNASEADYGKFICPECSKPVGLRKTHKGKKSPHFYHTGRLETPNCKFSYYEDNWDKR